MMGKFPGRYDSTLSYKGKTFRSAKAVREFCADNSIEYADASVEPKDSLGSISYVSPGESDLVRSHTLRVEPKDSLGSISYVGMDLNDLNFEGDMLDANEYPYRTLVGILMFISRCTRPDICVAINILASKSLGLDVNCYVDASWATFVKDRKSITGNLICVGKNPIIWRCTKQSLVTMSAMEAELIALSELVKEMIWFKRCLVEFGKVQGLQFSSFVIHCDNRAGMHFVKNDVENSKTRYIDVKIQFVKENYESKLFSLQYVNTKENLADILTKRVSYQKIADLCRYLDLYDLEH
uniref:Reverse transcriptase Ty1/copia-type domain-containing protein n=1 Tax=Strigamia maritima TaxID=126957 RepID=T1IJG5_STRMM